MTGQKIKPPLKEDGKLDLDFAIKHRKGTLKVLFLTGVSFLVILNISLFVTLVFTLSRVKKLENEVDGLKDTLSHMKSRDDNLINAIEGFEDIYDEDQEGGMEIDPELLIAKPDEPSYYVDYDNYDDRTLNKTDVEDDDVPQIVNNSGNTKVAIQERYSSRKRRDIVAATNDGIVINSESYAERRARNNTRNRMRLRSGYSGIPVSSESYFSRASTQHQHNSETDSTSHITSPNTRKQVKYVTKTPPPVFTRRSRVMHTEDKSKAFRQVVRKSSLKSGDVLNSNEEATPRSDFTIVRDNGYEPRRYRQRLLGLENLDGHPRVGRIKLPSVHYSGDTSKYVVGQHTNFNGNGHLRHPQRTFVDWKVSDWVKSTGLDAHFKMEDGVLTVKESGLYFVYAQHLCRVYYQVQTWLGKDIDHEQWGWIRMNDILQPVPTQLPPASDILLNSISFTCTKGCAGKCSCRKVGLNCPTDCGHCHGHSCLNTALIIAVNDEMDEVESYQNERNDNDLSLDDNVSDTEGVGNID